MYVKLCVNCGRRFYYADGEEWKTLCIPCWKRSKGIDEDKRVRDYKDDIIDRLNKHIRALENHIVEMTGRNTSGISQDDIKTLVYLCHPDKHNGSKAAVEISKKLIKLRGQ